MDANSIKEFMEIHEQYKKENKDELLMLVKAADKLEMTRLELEKEKNTYKKSFSHIIKDNFKVLLVCASLAIALFAISYIPADFNIELGSIKIQKIKTCEKLLN